MSADEGSPRRAYVAALRHLARRDHSEHELRGRLAEAGYGPGPIEAALSRLKAERLLDDNRFAAAFARSRLSGRGLGSLRIGAELRRRGVGHEPIEAALSQALADVPQHEVVDEVIRRLARQSRGQPPERRLRRIWAALLRRGFPPALARARLEVLKPAWRDMLESPAFEASSEEPEGPAAGGRDERD